ncbi:MAG: alpha/beta hydrolase [Acidimicrobiales bacterium]
MSETVEHDPPLAAPRKSAVMREAGAIREIPRLLHQLFSWNDLPRGDAAIVTFPGFGTGDAFLSPLRAGLRRLGHDTSGWGLGRNRGDVAAILPDAIDVIENRAGRVGPVSLVGWSLGGVFAREIARDRPDLVDAVFTFGTPVVGGPRFTRSARHYGEQRMSEIDDVALVREVHAIERPITAFHSRRDAVVDWRACIDHTSPHVANIEVRSTHVGMTIDPDVWSGIASRL